MLNANLANLILDGLFAMNEDKNEEGLSSSEYGKKIVFLNDLYLGLLTKLPTTDDPTCEEPAIDAEGGGYMRIKLNAKNRINKLPFLGGATLGEPTTVNGETVIPAIVMNQGPILFPEATQEEGYTILGFGIFGSASLTDNIPSLWGELAESIKVDQFEVPVIREEGLKVSLV